jgi:hypothetical protein
MVTRANLLSFCDSALRSTTKGTETEQEPHLYEVQPYHLNEYLQHDDDGDDDTSTVCSISTFADDYLLNDLMSVDDDKLSTTIFDAVKDIIW